MSYRVAMDIGGTFTDFVVIDEDEQSTSTGKTSTTPASPEEGVLEGIAQVVPELPAIVVHRARDDRRPERVPRAQGHARRCSS